MTSVNNHQFNKKNIFLEEYFLVYFIILYNGHEQS